MVDSALGSDNFDVAASSGVQATIAFADALTVAKLGLRSRGQDHRDVVTLIARIRSPRAGRIASLVQAVLDQKNEVEYGESQVGRSEARGIVERVRELRQLIQAEVG